jgi:hypothetical protein
MGRDPGPLTTAQRKRLRSSQFALPERRALPIVDKRHVRNAAARLEQMYRLHGTVTRDEYKEAKVRIWRAEKRLGIGPWHARAPKPKPKAKKRGRHGKARVRKTLARKGSFKFSRDPWKDRLRGGLADKLRPRDLSPRALRQGARVEREHTSDRHLAREIAMDHLVEDPRYYTKLAKMEGKRSGARRKKRGRHGRARVQRVLARKRVGRDKAKKTAHGTRGTRGKGTVYRPHHSFKKTYQGEEPEIGSYERVDERIGERNKFDREAWEKERFGRDPRTHLHPRRFKALTKARVAKLRTVWPKISKRSRLRTERYEVVVDGLVVGHVKGTWLGEATKRARLKFGPRALAYAETRGKPTPVGSKLWGRP